MSISHNVQHTHTPIGTTTNACGQGAESIFSLPLLIRPLDQAIRSYSNVDWNTTCTLTICVFLGIEPEAIETFEASAFVSFVWEEEVVES